MRQLRLDDFFDVPRRPCSGRSFLDLPSAIRCRIYDEACLIMHSEISLAHSRRQNRDLEFPDVSDASEGAESLCHTKISWDGYLFTYNLLQTSRAIYNEIVPVIYSSNTFMIRRRDLGSLQPLRNLSPKSLASLTHLVIRLNGCSCDVNEECGKSGLSTHPHFPLRPDKPLGNISHADKAVIMEWRRTAARLASNMQAYRLSIKFTCDTQDYETAKQVVEPFKQFPLLKSCAIRLSRQPDPALRQLAEETAVYSTTDARTNRFSTPFPFTFLPKELQTRILRFSDLVAPSEIHWHPGRGFRLWRSRRSCYHSFLGCYCRRYHAAFSQRCKCWQPPTSLFLVDHAMRRDALEVFYSQNRFVIVPWGGRHSPALSTPARVEASLFLRDLVPTFAIHHLRSLEIIFPPFEGDYLTSDSAGYRDWHATISHLAEHANLPKLVLMILMDDIHDGYPISYRAGLTRDKAGLVLKMYGRVSIPFVRLKGLMDLFVHLVWPRDSRERRVSEEYEEFRRNNRTIMERKFEQRAMGEGYDSNARGKDRWLSLRASEYDYSAGTDSEDSDYDDEYIEQC